MLSANTVAQIPAGSVRPPLSPAHFAGSVVSEVAAVAELSPVRRSPELQPTTAAARRMLETESPRRTTVSIERRIRASFERLS